MKKTFGQKVSTKDRQHQNLQDVRQLLS